MGTTRSVWNETDDVDDDGDVDSTLDVVVDRVSDVPTTPRRVQSTRLSAWANRSRVLTPVKSDDTEEEGHGRGGGGGIPIPRPRR